VPRGALAVSGFDPPGSDGGDPRQPFTEDPAGTGRDVAKELPNLHS